MTDFLPVPTTDDLRRMKWDARFMALAKLMATWSKDPATKVGAVLVRPDRSIAATGFNGFPPGWDDDPEIYANRWYKNAHVIHAEINALKYYGLDPVNFTVYTSFPPCPSCVDALGRAGVARIVFPPLPTEGRHPEWVREWSERLVESKVTASWYGVRLEVYDV